MLINPRPLSSVAHSFNVSVKSKLQIPPPAHPPGHLTFLINVEIPPSKSQNDVQMPHTRVYSGDKMPPPRGHFAGTWMTEGRERMSSVVDQNLYKYSK